jgi:hypothetical protein
MVGFAIGHIPSERPAGNPIDELNGVTLLKAVEELGHADQPRYVPRRIVAIRT